MPQYDKFITATGLQQVGDHAMFFFFFVVVVVVVFFVMVDCLFLYVFKLIMNVVKNPIMK